MERQPCEGLDAWRQQVLRVLREDAGPGLEESSAERPSGLTELLAFRVAEEAFGVEVREVAEILLPRVLTPVPRSPRFVLGVASLRGAVLPVLDLALRLGLERSEPGKASRIVILKDAAERLGFWVDQVLGVMRLAEDEIERAGFAAAVDPRFLKGIGCDQSGRLVALVSSERLCDFRWEET